MKKTLKEILVIAVILPPIIYPIIKFGEFSLTHQNDRDIIFRNVFLFLFATYFASETYFFIILIGGGRLLSRIFKRYESLELDESQSSSIALLCWVPFSILLLQTRFFSRSFDLIELIPSADYILFFVTFCAVAAFFVWAGTRMVPIIIEKSSLNNRVLRTLVDAYLNYAVFYSAFFIFRFTIIETGNWLYAVEGKLTQFIDFSSAYSLKISLVWFKSIAFLTSIGINGVFGYLINAIIFLGAFTEGLNALRKIVDFIRKRIREARQPV